MRVTKVEYIKDYKLRVFFSDKTVKLVDLKDTIQSNRGIFSPLKDLEYFKQVVLDDCQLSICWPNGADICPDVLYEIGSDIPKKKPPSAKVPPKRHRKASTKSVLNH